MLYTIGHGTLAGQAFIDLLRGSEIAAVADVRSVPKSRHNPQFAQPGLERSLLEAGLGYRWYAQLGGFRRAEPDSPNVGLRHAAFRGYADYMQTPPFRSAFEALLEAAQREPTAAMCSESVWWRCHRRLLADFAVLVAGIPVQHLMHDGRAQAHRVTPGARVADGVLVYEAAEPQGV